MHDFDEWKGAFVCKKIMGKGVELFVKTNNNLTTQCYAVEF